MFDIILSAQEMFEEKLVRDKIPEIVGSSASVRVASTRELQDLLKEKLIEETTELVRAHSVDEFIEELADVVEVVDAIKNYIECISPGKFDRVRTEKATAKGCFEHGYVMHVKSK